MNNIIARDRDIPEHFQTILMKSEMERLKRIVDEKSTKEALSVAVDFTIKYWAATHAELGEK